MAGRLQVGTALLHLGGVRFPVTGPVRYTMTGRDRRGAVPAASDPHTVVPVHYEGWSHFSEGRADVEQALASASDDLRRRFRWLPLGAGVELEV